MIRIDWQMLALQLRKHVKPLTQISRELGRHKHWLNEVASGQIGEPRFSDAVALLDYAHDHLPSDVFKACASEQLRLCA